MQHFDIKVPAEHTINGETFDAEIQMFHVSLQAPRLNSLGILIRADDGFDNAEYSVVLNEFQAEYDLHALECAQKRHRQRRMSLRGAVDDETVKTLDTDEETDDEDVYAEQIQKIKEARKLQWTTSNFNPYSEDFMTTMFFFRYDGSITEPPCRDITWWVMDKPMRISHRQLEWTKKILFSHVDSNCVATSVHNSDQSVARPIFELGEEREMQHCSDGAFRSDVDKGRPAGRQCRS
jgi:carbonic anhydrase